MRWRVFARSDGGQREEARGHSKKKRGVTARHRACCQEAKPNTGSQHEPNTGSQHAPPDHLDGQLLFLGWKPICSRTLQPFEHPRPRDRQKILCPDSPGALTPRPYSVVMYICGHVYGSRSFPMARRCHHGSSDALRGDRLLIASAGGSPQRPCRAGRKLLRGSRLHGGDPQPTGRLASPVRISTCACSSLSASFNRQPQAYV